MRNFIFPQPFENKVRSVLLLLFITGTVFFRLTIKARAAFEEPYWSARVASLGGAFIGLSDDASAVFYNPAAGADNIKQRQGNFTYAKLFAGLEDVNLSTNQLGLVYPWGRNNLLGIGWANFNASNLYREDTITASYARLFNNLFGSQGTKLGLGFSIKYLFRGFTLNDRSSRDPVFRDGNKKQAVAFDLHAYFAPKIRGLSLGLTVRSLNRPDIGLAETERLPMEIIGGLLYKWKFISLPIDISSRNGSIVPRVGMEIWAKDNIALRLGGESYQIGAGFGYRYDLSKNFSLIFDYSFQFPLHLEETSGSHRATFGIKF